MAAQRPTLPSTSDGEPAREYRNDGTGLSEVSGKNYNEAHGRKADAPTSGGSRQAAYDALLSSEKRVPGAYRKESK